MNKENISYQLDRIYLAYKVLAQLPQLNIRCLPFFICFVSTNFRISSYTLQASQICTLFCLANTRVLLPTKNPSASDIHTIEFFIKVLVWGFSFRRAVGPMVFFSDIKRSMEGMHWYIPNDPNVWNIYNLHVLDIEDFLWACGRYLIAILEALLKLEFQAPFEIDSLLLNHQGFWWPANLVQIWVG